MDTMYSAAYSRPKECDLLKEKDALEYEIKLISEQEGRLAKIYTSPAMIRARYKLRETKLWLKDLLEEIDDFITTNN